MITLAWLVWIVIGVIIQFELISVPTWTLVLVGLVISVVLIATGIPALLRSLTVTTAGDDTDSSNSTAGSDDSSSDSAATTTPSTTSSSNVQTAGSSSGWGLVIALLVMGAIIGGVIYLFGVNFSGSTTSIEKKVVEELAIEATKMKAAGWEILTILSPDEDGFITILPGTKWERNKTVWFKDFRYTAKKYQGKITPYSLNGERGITLSVVGQLTLKPLNKVPSQVWARVQ